MAQFDHITDQSGYLSGKVLIAMPQLTGSIFGRSVIYMCAHSAMGAMGIIINQPVEKIRFADLLSQLGIPPSQLEVDPVVHLGGPVDPSRGFVLHTKDFMRAETVRLGGDLGVTGTVEILKSIAHGAGPRKSLFALGYAGWGPGQLEGEIEQNGWLVAPADQTLIFDTPPDQMWDTAMRRIGVDPANLSSVAGRA